MGHQPVGNGKIGSRTVVITGGNTGLGFACANAILKSPHGAPWRVVLACRDEGRARSAVDQLTGGNPHSSAPHGNFDFADLSVAPFPVGCLLRWPTEPPFRSDRIADCARQVVAGSRPKTDRRRWHAAAAAD